MTDINKIYAINERLCSAADELVEEVMKSANSPEQRMQIMIEILNFIARRPFSKEGEVILEKMKSAEKRRDIKAASEALGLRIDLHQDIEVQFKDPETARLRFAKQLRPKPKLEIV